MRHVPVLLNEVIDSLQLSAGMNVIDCTLGDAGHAEVIVEKIAPKGMLLGFDADPESLLRAKQHLYDAQDRVTFVRENFSSLSDTVAKEEFGPVHAILFDLGWSSPQFEDRGRGFSFQNPSEPLDMRYDTRMKCMHKLSEEEIDRMKEEGKIYYGKCTAAELVNSWEEAELERIFREYADENLSEEIAQGIVHERKEFEIETAGDLVEIVLKAYRKKLKTEKDVPWVGGTHPATRTFQALRIAVNDELAVIRSVLPQAIDVAAPGARIAVITFHSVEDRIVKHYFKSESGKRISIITKKPITASGPEIKTNPRARSAKLRVVEKI